MDDTETTQRRGMDRRALIRRGAIGGGALIWAVPTVQTLAGPAFAAGSPCMGRVTYTDTRGICLFVDFTPTNACCDCIAANSGGPGGVLVASFVCLANGSCGFANVGSC